MKYWQVITEGNEKCSLFFKADTVEQIRYGSILIDGKLEIKTQYQVIEIKSSDKPM